MSDKLIELKGCGSHSCAVSPPVGVGNNGPCRCMVSDYRGQSLVRSLQARVAELENHARAVEYNLEVARENCKRLDAALKVIEDDQMLPEPIRKFAKRARAGK